jgi:hypothetical protein
MRNDHYATGIEVSPVDKLRSAKASFSENPNTDNSVADNDRHKYWSNIDASFIHRLKSTQTYYADGHMSINTSNHWDIGNFCCSMLTAINTELSRQTKKQLDKRDLCYDSGTVLNTTPNTEGFERRKAKGRVAGKNFADRLKASAFSASDTLDIVCHSMGFAYALGMVEEIKAQIPNIKLGGFYIIAPENGCSGTVNLADWQEIWQYGTDEVKDPIHLQDGVAPQCPVSGLLPVQNKSGRAYIPDDAPKGFVSSHSI